MFDDDDRVALIHQSLQNPEQLAHVFEVKTRGGLIQDVDRFPVGPLLELGGKLDPLGFSTGKGGCRLTKTDVPKPHLDQGIQVTRDGGVGLEEPGRLLDGHIKHIRDVLPVVGHLQRLPVVPLSMAGLALNIDIRKEVHLYLDGPVSVACLATTTLDVEGEPAGPVATHLGFGCLGEELSYLVPDSGVRGRV